MGEIVANLLPWSIVVVAVLVSIVQFVAYIWNKSRSKK